MNHELCTGCGLCIEVCPREVFARLDRKIEIVDPDACMECGACSKNCATGAIYVKSGVGCASAVINSFLGRKSSSCCCVIETDENSSQYVHNESSGCC